MRRLAWTVAARIGDKYQIRLTQSILYYYLSNLGLPDLPAVRKSYGISTRLKVFLRQNLISWNMFMLLKSDFG